MTLCGSLPESANCDKLEKQVIQLRNFRTINDQLLLNAYLASLGNGVQEMRNDVDEAIQQRLSEQQADLSTMQYKQAWSTALLSSVSLLLLLRGSVTRKHTSA